MIKIKILITCLVLSNSLGFSQNESTYYLSLKEIETKPKGQFLLHYPNDHMKLKINPPGFTWTKNEKAHNYDFILFKGKNNKEILLKKEKLSNTITTLRRELDPAEYGWIIIYNDSLGNALGRSKLRTFTVEKNLPSLVMPDITKLKEQLKKVNSRFFLTPSILTNLQANIAKNPKKVPFWELCRSLADSAISQPLYPEPAPYKDSIFEVSEWRRIYKPVKTGTANMVRMALVWKITNEQKYLDSAKEWLVHFASWDPDGITSFRVPQASGFMGNTEASMPLLERMAIVYDWIKNELNSDEKKAVLSSLNDRGNQMLKRYTDVKFISEPWDNHTVRSLPFTGIAALSTLGDLPDAEKWLDYVIQCYLTSFPTWGGDDGGWSQGLSYSSTYNLYQTNFVEALNLCSTVNLYNKPFFKNNGYFGVYCFPPYATRGAFGDGGEYAHRPKDKILMQRYANTYNDPILLWQAENINPNKNKKDQNEQLLSEEYLWEGYYMEDVISILSLSTTKVKPIKPNKLPQSKLFNDIGWVAMHSDLGNAENDVWMLFKSSPFGSFSHSHADQNSFQINAYGESLIIDSGYYPWYGGPHHFLWSRQTKAHNAILVNGRGQNVQSMEASGVIEKYSFDDEFTIVTGECSKGYNLPMNEKVIELWKNNLKEPLPSPIIDTKVQDVRRTIVFNHDKENPWIIVQDYINTEDPATFDYLLHALEEMKLDSTKQQLLVQKGDAILDIYVLSSDQLKMKQTDKFNVDPDESNAGARNQWHFSASNINKKKEVHFLTLMIPRRKETKPLEVKQLKHDDVKGFQIGNHKILGWFGNGENGDFYMDNTKELNAKLIIEDISKEESKKTIVH